MTTTFGAANFNRVVPIGASSSSRVRGSKRASLGFETAAAGTACNSAAPRNDMYGAPFRARTLDICAHAPNIRRICTLSRPRADGSQYETEAGTVQLSGLTPGCPARDPILRPVFGDGGVTHDAVLDPGETAPSRTDDDQRARRRPRHGSHDARPESAAARARGACSGRHGPRRPPQPRSSPDRCRG